MSLYFAAEVELREEHRFVGLLGCLDSCNEVHTKVETPEWLELLCEEAGVAGFGIQN
jgi:hypothetical protein